MLIETVEDLRKVLKEGPYAWPGGYPLYYVTADGGTLLPSTVEAEQEQIEEAIREDDRNGGWRVVGVDINYESELYDDHTGEQIPAAYGVYNEEEEEKERERSRQERRQWQEEAPGKSFAVWLRERMKRGDT
jgi:hypothetical protein